MRRNAALTVRLPGARIAPAKSTWTCGHRRLENSGTKGLSRCSIVVGRVRIITSLWRTGDDRTLPLLTLTKWTKSSVEDMSNNTWPYRTTTLVGECQKQPQNHRSREQHVDAVINTEDQ